MRTQAIILKKIPIREYDELIVCYTEHAGKQTYQAKSVLRHTSKQASHLDLLNLADFSLISGNGHAIITSAHSLRAYHKLKSNLRAMAVAFFILESFDKLIFEGEPDKKLWDFLQSSLEKIDELAGKKYARWASAFETVRKELLDVLGYDPSEGIENIAGRRFKSLHFARKVIR
jgi:DNA repair protein RecO (recombination protein O)